ncbi:MAG: helix-turn-helix domain-containing protein [Planctomycetota bacterium]|nr:helix-turn-helix domain-containing protein [Planctomycetota bacterium]
MGSRSYRQVCSVARALDLVGERWTLLLIRDLFPGPLGYNALLEGLPGLTTNLLATRLRSLTGAGLIERVPAPDDKHAKAHYRLTEAGRALGPALAALSDWGGKYGPPPSPTDALSVRHLLLIFQRHYRQVDARSIVQLECGEARLQVRLGGPTFEGVEGTPMRPDLTLTGAPPAWYHLLFDDTNASDPITTGSLTLTPGEATTNADEIWSAFRASFQLD